MGTVTAAEAVLFSSSGSTPLPETVAWFVNEVPCGVPGGMCVTSENVALCPATSVAVQLIVPPDPGVGCVGHGKLGPLVCVMETKVIVPGSVSVSEMSPLSGPLFPAVIVNVTSVSAVAVLGPVFVTNKSVSGTVVIVALPELLPLLESAGLLEAVAVF